jgi:hypothetical protein
MLATWGIEAYKWRRLMRTDHPLSFNNAARGVLAGITLSSFTPNRIGEYAGRILFVPHGHRGRGVLLSLAGSFSQVAVTLIAGAAALLLAPYGRFFIPHTPLWLSPGLPWLAAGGAALAVFLYYRYGWLAALASRLGMRPAYKRVFAGLQLLRPGLLSRVLWLSLLRYAAFSVQYVLLIRFFGVDLPWWPCLQAVCVVFLALFIIPTFTLTEAATRGAVAVAVFATLTPHASPVALAAIGLWLINLILPAIAGLVPLLAARIGKGPEEPKAP